ncbi:MAG TPA: hypothetical protein VEI97_06025 [bacterium]|nr:hypothetical protein [bacterium]
MKLLWTTVGLAAVGLLAGCTDGPDSTLISAIAGGPAGQALMAGAAQRPDRDGSHRSGGRRGDPLMGFLKDNDCAQITGSPREGGQAVLTNCEGPGGTTMSGTITWSGVQEGADGSHIGTTSKTLTIARPAGADGPIPEMGPLHRLAEDQGFDLEPVAWDRAEVSSQMSMGGTKGDRESFRRTGTTTVTLFNGGSQVRTVDLTWNGDKTVTVTIDGQTRTINLPEMRGRHHRGPGDEGRGHRGGPEGGPGGPDHHHFPLDDECATVNGSRQAGGSVTFTGCEGPGGGTLNGTITWSGDQDPSETGFSSSENKQLTVTRPAGAEGPIPGLGPMGRTIREELDIEPVAWDRAEVRAQTATSGTKGDRESYRRTGTTTVNLYNGSAQVRTIAITWNGDKTVTVSVDGQSRTINLEERIREFRGGRKGPGGEDRIRHRQRGEAEAGRVAGDTVAGT